MQNRKKIPVVADRMHLVLYRTVVQEKNQSSSNLEALMSRGWVGNIVRQVDQELR